MLRSILSAIRSAFALFWAMLCLPGRLLTVLLGGVSEPPPAPGSSPLVTDLKKELADRQASLDNHAKVAKAVRNWCVDSIIDDKPAPVPSWLPRDIKTWLPGVSRDECECLISADKEAISAHVRRLFPLKGVQPVQPLEPAEWPPEPTTSVELAPDFAHHSVMRPAA